ITWPDTYFYRFIKTSPRALLYNSRRHERANNFFTGEKAMSNYRISRPRPGRLRAPRNGTMPPKPGEGTAPGYGVVTGGRLTVGVAVVALAAAHEWKLTSSATWRHFTLEPGSTNAGGFGVNP